MAIKTTCLNRYDSVLFDNLYARVPVLLYTTSRLIIVSTATMAHMTLSPLVLLLNRENGEVDMFTGSLILLFFA
jgi:hypothetical protein